MLTGHGRIASPHVLGVLVVGCDVVRTAWDTDYTGNTNEQETPSTLLPLSPTPEFRGHTFHITQICLDTETEDFVLRC